MSSSIEVEPGLPGETAPPTCGDRPRDLLAMQRAVVAVGRRAIAPPEISVLLQDAAALLAEMLESDGSGVAELSPDGQRLHVRLALGGPETAERQVVVDELPARGGDSLAGHVLQVARPVIVDDFLQENRFTSLLLRQHGIRSAIAAPLNLHDRAFGSLATYSKRAGYFDQRDLPFLETITHLVATTIARTQAEQSLAEERRLSTSFLETVEALVLVLDNQWRIVRINRACERITGFALAEIKTRSVWSVLCDAVQAEMPQRLLAQLQEKSSPACYEGYLLTKHASRRQIAWSFSALPDNAGNVQRIIATGIDVTLQHTAEEKAQRAERLAAEARKNLAKLAAADARTTAAGAGQSPASPRQAGAFAVLPGGLNAERRKRPRRSYPYTQVIAPIVDDKLPTHEQFYEVECNDIAAGGFSFLSTQPPSFDSLVVALGVPPKVTYLTAQVAHVTRVEHRGKRMFLTGCNYTGRPEC